MSDVLRYPNLHPTHPLNIIDPDSDVPPHEQVFHHRRAGKHLLNRGPHTPPAPETPSE
jgi:hypothetical protein